MENLTCPSLETIKLVTTWFLPEIKPTVGGFSLFANKGSIESFASHRHKHTWFVHWLDTLLDGHLTDIIRICTMKGRYPAQEWKKQEELLLWFIYSKIFHPKSTLGIRLFSPLGYVASLHQSKAGSLLTVSDTCFGKPGIQTGQPTAVCWAESVRNRTEERWQDGPGFAGSHVTF